MSLALDMARKAEALDEVPIGAVLVFEDRVIASGYNRTRIDIDPTAHAEILALREGARVLANYRLLGSALYTTVEPCAMCAGALVWARVERLVYGAPDERAGAAGSVFQICSSPAVNHRIEITSGVMLDECRALMQDFFRRKRVG